MVSSANEGGDPGASLLLHLEVEKYESLILLVSFLLAIALLLLLFKETRLHAISEKVPESLLLILLGLAIAVIAYLCNVLKKVPVTYTHFFNFLLPPIILNSAYQLYCKPFVMNLDGVVLLALIGTTLNVTAIGLSLYAAYGQFYDLNVLKCLLLASVISAVDPVAVLAVFNQIGVQAALYFLIFGESLFNDGVTVVLFDTLEKIAFSPVESMTYVYAFLSFFTVAFGGMVIGILYGVLASLACKFTTKRSRMLEPTVIFLTAYMSFLNAQFFHWSGIMALIGCGLTQKRYAFENIFEKSRITVETGAEILASVAETIIFLVLGFSVFLPAKAWDLRLIAYSILFCLVYRFIITYTIGYIMNTYRLHKLTPKHLFMMSYGGLRGAVSFAMAASIHKGEGELRDKYLATTLCVIMFTVFLQGGTIRFWVNIFDFKANEKKKTFTSTAINRIDFHILAGMETIMGGGGSTIHSWMEWLEMIDKKYFRPYLCIRTSDLCGFSHMLEMESTVYGRRAQSPSMWGALQYARARVSPTKIEAVDERERREHERRERKNDLWKFKQIMRDEEEIDTKEEERSKFATDDKLNLAWKRKLHLISLLKREDERAHEGHEDGL